MSPTSENIKYCEQRNHRVALCASAGDDALIEERGEEMPHKKQSDAQMRQAQRRRALLLQMRGTARTNTGELQHAPAPVTLPKINVPTLAEIEAKYGRADI